MDKKIKIGIIFGGLSCEAEVSLTGGRNVFNNIDRLKFEPLAIYWDKQAQFWLLPEVLLIRNTTKEIGQRLTKQANLISYEDLKNHLDLAFLITHGKFGDDGCLQGLLELQGIPYTGSGVLSAALGLDKNMQRKLIREDKSINQPPYLIINQSDWQKDSLKIIANLEKEFNYPLVIKPTREGSTMGVVLIKNKEEFSQKIQQSFEFDNRVIIEPYLKGREFSCMVMGGSSPYALLPTETIHQNEIFSYDEKYLPGASAKITPMDIDEKILKEIQRQSLQTFKILGCKDYARIDGFVLENKKVLITDPNSAASTGLGPSSWTWHQATKEGYSVKDFISKIIQISLKNQKDKNYFLKY